MTAAAAEMRRLAEQLRADAEKARSLVKFVPARADKDRLRQAAADLEREAAEVEGRLSVACCPG